jgi:hypothetical protein
MSKENNAFVEYINICSKIVGAGLDTVIMAPSKKGTLLYSIIPGTVLKSRVPSNIEGLDSPISISRNAFIQALRGRSEVSLTFKDNSISVSSGKYRASLSVEVFAGDLPEILPPEENSATTIIPLESDFWAALADSLPHLKIDKAHASLADPFLYGMVSEKEIFLAVTESYQGAFVRIPNENRISPLKFVIPYQKILSIVKGIPSVGSTIYISQGELWLISKQFQLQTSVAVPEDESQTPETVREKCLAVKKSAKGSTIQFPSQQLQEFLDNTKSVSKDDSVIHFQSKKSRVRCTLTSNSGTVSETFEAQDDAAGIDFKLDPRFVMSLVSKSDENLNFGVVDNSILFSSSSKACYLSMLNAEASK